ncbi:MAG: O-antigen ligase family protein [Phycisphaerae bacterium]|jgi:O-antigen ligase|nr:O-antigen ligase family protein [Phycisphaerae bacterium]
MTHITDTADETTDRGHLPGAIALALLLATLVGRVVLPEMPFRTSPLAGLDSGADAEGTRTILLPNHIDLANMTFGVTVLLAGVFWLVGEAMRGRLRVRAGWLGITIAIFAIWSLVSALRSGDRRGALLFWTNQASLMLAGWLAIQLCTRPKYRSALLAVLAAVGVMLAIVGLRQYFIDAPQRIADFEARGAEILAARQWAPHSPQAIAFKERLFKAVPLGFFALANVFASVMIVLVSAAIGLAVDRWRKVLPNRKATAHLRKRGDIHLPTLAAAITIIAPPLGIAALVLAMSRGAIAAAAAAGVAAVVVLRFRKSLAAHWRRWVVVAVLLSGAGVATVIACGLKYDSLGARTMTFRWYYWTTGAEIAADEPLWGVGPGGFGSAYEARRRPAGEETVKTPHNFVVHAAAQYGLIGGFFYAGIVAMVLWALCRPVRRYPEPIDPAQRYGPGTAAMIIWIPSIVVASACLFGGARGNAGVMFQNAIEPAVILAVALAMMLWWGPRFSPAASDGQRVTRVVLACGLVAFVAHNTVSFSLWMPGAAIAFWLAAGAVISLRRPEPMDISPLRWVAVGGSVASTIAVIAVLWWPVAQRSWATEMTVDSLIARDGQATLDWARRAAECDTLDPIAAADIARLLKNTGRNTDLEQAYRWAKEAIRRDPRNSTNHRLAAEILWASPGNSTEAVEHMARAVQRDPQSLSMRIEFAEKLISAGRGKRAMEQLRAAEEINDALLDGSIFKLNTAAMSKLQALKARGGAMGGQ